ASEDAGSCLAPSAAALGSCHDQQARKAVEDEGKNEEHQAKLDQGFGMEIAGGFGEFIGDDGGNGIARRKERCADDRGIADNRGDGHSFAESPSRGQENGGADAEGHGEQQRYRRGDERAVNEGRSAELLEDGVPDGGAKKIEAELMPRENRALPQFENEEESDEHNGSGE